MSELDTLLMRLLDDPYRVVAAGVAIAALGLLLVYRHESWYTIRFVFKSLRRNLLRTSLTALATMAFVFMVTLVWTVLWFLDLVTTEKSKDQKAIITERWQLPSQMPFAYATSLEEGGYRNEGDYRVDTTKDSMTWQFYGGTLDPGKMTRENIVFFFCMDPDKLIPMMDGMDEFTPEQIEQLRRACDEMKKYPNCVLVGQDRLAALNKQVGETFTVHSINYKDINLECKIIGTFPKGGRYDQSALMNRDYLNNALDAYKAEKKVAHPLANKSLNLVWVRVPNTKTFQRVAEQIQGSSLYADPAVKCETASSGVASFLDAYRDLLWGARWLFVPAAVFAMALVIANAISISVRERRTEMAVLKVLGFGPTQIMILVLLEAVLVGALSGFISAGLTYWIVNVGMGGFKFPIAFFPAFKIPTAALAWGPLLGGLTALAGSVLPAWSARSVRVSEVFSKVA